MKIGDLVCYNAAGMKNKTLGLVLDISEESLFHSAEKALSKVLIQWCLVGEYMPKKNVPWGTDEYHAPIVNGSVVWHSVGTWFEVIGE